MKKGSLTGQVISHQGNPNVDQIVQPSGHDGSALVGDDLDEFTLKQLVPVEEHVIGEPPSRGGDHPGSKVRKGQLQRIRVVPGHLALLLRGHQLLARRAHLEGSVVDQPQRADGRNGERNPIGPLRRQSGIRRVSGTVVKAEQQQNEEHLVEELPPSLHQESTGHFAAPVQAIFPGGDLS